MSLPDRSIPWPPADIERERAQFDIWGAWYGGDPEELTRVYGGSSGVARADLKVHSWQYSGGVRGAIGRFFWGAPPTEGQQPTRLHVPLAADIASVNADLLYTEPPTLKVENENDRATQERLERLFTLGMHAPLLEGAELCSPYGGVYERVAWDTDVADHPFLEVIPPDCAIPEWSGPYLKTVTFWKVLSDDDGVYWRHLERHEPGRVYHGLYRGTEDRLGRPMPLADHPDTEKFASRVDSQGGITTGASGLAVQYVPNMRPNRLWRGSPLGRSDYQGSEGLFDGLDEAWSSWMRDLRLAKARLIVPNSFLDSAGRGKGATFDMERELFSGVTALQGGNERFSDMIREIQFDIRFEAHAATIQALSEEIVRAAGFSAQTFGEGPADVAVTATEVQHRERRTFSTRGRKTGYQDQPLARNARTFLEIDRHVFRSKVTPQDVRVIWPDGVQNAPESTARTAQMLHAAKAASTETLVRLVHPDWEKEQVDKEVAKIQAQQPVWDPFAAPDGPRPDGDENPDGAPERPQT